MNMNMNMNKKLKSIFYDNFDQIIEKNTFDYNKIQDLQK